MVRQVLNFIKQIIVKYKKWVGIELLSRRERETNVEEREDDMEGVVLLNLLYKV